MIITNPIRFSLIILGLIASIFTQTSFAKDLSFTDNSFEEHDTTNPINEVSSGSIIYYLPSSDYLTQVALDTKVQMNITGTINRVRVEQTFTNPSNEWVEGVYVFPLPEDSAVDHLTMYIGDRVLEGQIKERQQAKKIYEKAKKEGKKASLIEQQRPNIFTTSVANIAPGESITIAIEYQQAVLLDNEQFSIRFPMVVGDRYVPGRAIATPRDSLGHSLDTNQVPDASKVTPPSDPFVDRPVNISINLRAGFKPESISSSYHAVNVIDIDSTTKHITLTNPNVQAERDFVLSWQAHTSLQPEVSIFTQKRGDDYYLMLMATPPKAQLYKVDSTPREIIFIIDSSGSMSGSSMHQAKNALAQAVLSLKPTDRFNVIDFDSDYEPLFNTAMPAIEINKKHAIRFLGRLIANGGTEPLGAINYALNSRKMNSTNRLRQIIFITDGQVANEDEILYNVRRFINQDRLFTIGIGSAPNSFLMTKLADYGRGAFTHIGSSYEVEQKMLELFKKMSSPALTNIDIELPEAVQSEQAMTHIADLYVGETIVAAFKLSELPSTITITGKTIYGDYTKEITLIDGSQTTGIDVLWARRKIEGLMNQYRELYSGIERDDIQDSITNLALNYHLVSKFTSLVAVDVSPSRPEGEVLVSMPVIKKEAVQKDLALESLAALRMTQQIMLIPQTATNATLWMIIGLVLMFVALVFGRRRVT